MNPIMMIPNLPHNPPFVPNIEYRPQMANHVKLITGYLLQEIQSKAMADRSFMRNLYDLLSVNGFQNKHFTQLVQEVTDIIDYLIHNDGSDFNTVITKVIPSAVLSVAATIAQQNPQIMAGLNSQIQNHMAQTTAHYLQLQRTADNWLKGAKMSNYLPQNHYQQMPAGYPQPAPGQYPYPQGYPQGYPQPGHAVMQPAMGNMQQPAMSNPHAAAMYMQQQNALMAQQQMMLAQQQQAALQQQRNAQAMNQSYVPQAATGFGNQPYTPQVAGGVGGYYQQPSQVSGPRQSGLGAPGINPEPHQPSPEQQQYVPQAAASQQPPANNVPVYQQPISPSQPSNVMQPAAAAPRTMQPVQTPNVEVNQPLAKPIMEPISPNAAKDAVSSWKDSTNDESLDYNCVGKNNAVTRLPYLYDTSKEVHRVVMQNNVVIEQKVEPKGDTVNLNEHETSHYFPARTMADRTKQDVNHFTDTLAKSLESVELSKILADIEALQDPNEETIEKETAAIIKNALTKAIRIDKPIVSISNAYRVETESKLQGTKLDINLSKDIVIARHIEVNTWAIGASSAIIASQVSTASDLNTLHHNLKLLTERVSPEHMSPLLDKVTAFVNREMRRYFGLGYTISSFILDFQELQEVISLDHGVEFTTVVFNHLLERLTQTILYAYTADELSELTQGGMTIEPDLRIYATVKELVFLPVRSRDIPYSYNGKAGLLLNTEYSNLTRLIDKTLDENASPHTDELLIITLDNDAMRISPILNDNCYVLYK